MDLAARWVPPSSFTSPRSSWHSFWLFPGFPATPLSLLQTSSAGMALKEALSQHGVTMGMEPDSMEFSTLGGWISTKAGLILTRLQDKSRWVL